MTPIRKALLGGALAGTALLGGALGASFIGTASAQATDPSTTSVPATTGGSTESQTSDPRQANGGSETALTGDVAAKVTAAAQAAVPGATVDRVEADGDGAAYEAHMTKTDGTKVTVKLDSSFNVTGTETDQGRGGHGGPHQANGVTETVLTGDDASKATAAAQAAVPGASVERAETDAEGAAFEVHMTKSDGTKVTVKLDSSFKVTETIDGMG